jgi:hypothetical protein
LELFSNHLGKAYQIVIGERKVIAGMAMGLLSAERDRSIAGSDPMMKYKMGSVFFSIAKGTVYVRIPDFYF